MNLGSTFDPSLAGVLVRFNKPLRIETKNGPIRIRRGEVGVMMGGVQYRLVMGRRAAYYDIKVSKSVHLPPVGQGSMLVFISVSEAVFGRIPYSR